MYGDGVRRQSFVSSCRSSGAKNSVRAWSGYYILLRCVLRQLRGDDACISRGWS